MSSSVPCHPSSCASATAISTGMSAPRSPPAARSTAARISRTTGSSTSGSGTSIAATLPCPCRGAARSRPGPRPATAWPRVGAPLRAPVRLALQLLDQGGREALRALQLPLASRSGEGAAQQAGRHTFGFAGERLQRFARRAIHVAGGALPSASASSTWASASSSSSEIRRSASRQRSASSTTRAALGAAGLSATTAQTLAVAKLLERVLTPGSSMEAVGQDSRVDGRGEEDGGRDERPALVDLLHLASSLLGRQLEAVPGEQLVYSSRLKRFVAVLPTGY